MPFSQYSTSKFSRRKKDTTGQDERSVESVNRQIENAIKRIEDAGFTVSQADRRNAIEKALNLPEGQSALFDVLEVLGRPGRAVVSGVEAAVRGEEAPLRAAYEGLTGKRRTTGADLAETLGVENPVAKAIVGVALDIGLDPTTYIPGAVFAKGAQIAGRGVSAVGRGAMKAAERVAPTFTRETLRPGLQSVREGVGRMFVPDYKLDETLFGTRDDTVSRLKQQTENRIRFMTEESMKRVADAAKTAGGIERGTEVGRVMEAPLRQFEDIKGYEFPDGLRRTTNRQDLIYEANKLRDEIKTTGQEVNRIRRDYEKQISETAQQLERIDRQIRRYYFREENKALRQLKNRKRLKLPAGQTIEDAARNIAMQRVSPSPAFNLLLQRRDELKTQLDTLRQQMQQARQPGIERIRNLQSEVDALREAARNPVMIQREIERPVREMPSDPAVQQAARNLIRSNKELRQWALDNGVQIGELEGYMTHVLAAEERKRRRTLQAVSVDRGRFGTGQPNKRILEARKIPGSVEDINEQIGRTFFEPNAFFATAIGQKRLIEYVNAVNFRRQVLSNPNFAIKWEDYVAQYGDTIPTNAVVIDTNKYKFIDDETAKELGLETEIGGKYVVTKSVKAALDRFQRLTTDEGINAFLRAFDRAQSGWKRLALFSLAYHLRNDLGAKFNNWVGGMSLSDLAKYSAQADREVYNAIVRGKETPMFREYREQGLGSASLSAVEFARRGEEPEQAIRRTIEKRSKMGETLGGRIRAELSQVKKNPLNVFETSREFADFVDQTNRYALYKWARDKGMSPEAAAAKVREVQFDYTRLTPFEQEFMTRLFPFYRWIRNNLPFQIRQFINDPRKYANINKLRINLQEATGINEENVPEWMKEQFALPIYGREGRGQFLALNLPLSELTKAERPLKTIVDALTPIAKLPAELALNRNFFFNRPIEEFEGQREIYQLPFGGPRFGIDATTAYVLNQLGGQIGRGISGYLQAPESENQDIKYRTPSLGIRSLLKPFDVQQAEYFQQLDRLRKLQDFIDYIEQQTGQRPRTVREIERGR